MEDYFGNQLIKDFTLSVAVAASFNSADLVGSVGARDGEVPSEKKPSSYFEELFSSKVPPKELSSSYFPNPGWGKARPRPL